MDRACAVYSCLPERCELYPGTSQHGRLAAAPAPTLGPHPLPLLHPLLAVIAFQRFRGIEFNAGRVWAGGWLAYLPKPNSYGRGRRHEPMVQEAVMVTDQQSHLSRS